MKYLDYDGLLHFKKKLDELYATKGSIKDLSDTIKDIQSNIETNTNCLKWQ